MIQVRLLDTGVQHPRRHMAIDAALAEAHGTGHAPDTIRFMEFEPSVLIGRHQALAQEVDLAACATRHVATARRLTGGGTVYMDRGQVGWELLLRRDRLGTADLGEAAARICTAVADGLSALGVRAAFRPRNDIEVDGRKISGSGGFFDGSTLLFHGTVILTFDAAAMTALLRVPAAKLARHGAATVASRVTGLADILGAAPPVAEVKRAVVTGLSRGLGLDPREGPLTEAEAVAVERHFLAVGSDAFVDSIAPAHGPDSRSATVQTPGGTATLHLRLAGRQVREALFVGDLFVAPPRLLLDLEARLRGIPLADAPAVARAYLEEARPDTMSLPPAALAELVERATQP